MRANHFANFSAPTRAYTRGFTLIELIIGIVVFSIIMLVIIGVIGPQSRLSIEPIWQIRASELAQSLLTEINSKSFDEQSDRTGGTTRCNEVQSCTASGSLGPDSGESRDSFDDIDDYHGLNQTGANILNVQGQAMLNNGESLYSGFTAQVSVYYDSNEDGINDDDADQNGALDTGTLVGNVKRITITVITPGGEPLTFASYRWNF